MSNDKCIKNSFMDSSLFEKKFSLERMIEIALDLSAEKDFDMLMQKILLEAMEVCGCDAGTVYVKEEDRLLFHTVYTKSKGIPAAEQSRNADLPPVPLTRKHVCACSAIDNRKINIPDIYASKEYDFAGAQKDTPAYYSAMDVFLFPSLYEGLGSVLIEAQANGLYVVTSKDVVPDEIDVTGHAAFVPLAASPEEWAETVLSVPRKRTDWEADNLRVNESYNMYRIAETLADTYSGEKK